MKRNKINLSHYHLTTMDPGYINPVGCVEVIPGDTFDHKTSALVRVTPLIYPVMHPVEIKIHHWFVPNRIVWDGWEDFITGESETPPPTVTIADTTGSSLLFRLGAQGEVGDEVNALPVRCYNKIFNENYRDQDLVTEVTEDSLTLKRAAWEKDYFTSARPWPQKGTSVTIPLGDNVPVVSDGNDLLFEDQGGDTGRLSHDLTNNVVATGVGFTNNEFYKYGGQGLEVDLANATTADVRDFREAFALQRYQEARARYGSRYVEYLRYCGVNPSDARLQRPEYLGGGKQTITFSEVLSTAETTGANVGDMAGHGIAAMRTNRYRKYFEEHGHVISVAIVRPKAVYQDQLKRNWFRSAKEDYYQKELQYIGQQEIFNKEVYAGHSNPDGVFGYQNRYSELTFEPSFVSGEFSAAFDEWHMGRQFASDPALNQTFIECNPTTRVYANSVNHKFRCMFQHSLVARRSVMKNAPSRII